MAEQENIQWVRAFFENINRKTLDASDAFTAEDAQISVPGSPAPLTREQYKQYLQAFIDAFSDLTFTVHDIIADGDKVAAVWSGVGTNDGGLRTLTGQTLPVTQRRGDVPGASFVEFLNGKIIRHQINFDQMTLLGQLGLLPAPEGGD